MEAGIAPLLGFYEETFDKNSLRFKLQGCKLMGGWRGCFVGWKGDGKSRREAHLFARHGQTMFCCDTCFAVQSFKNAPMDLLYSDFSDSAHWLDTILSANEYLDLD